MRRVIRGSVCAARRAGNSGGCEPGQCEHSDGPDVDAGVVRPDLEQECADGPRYNRAIFTAASHAQRAAAFINGVQPAASAG